MLGPIGRSAKAALTHYGYELYRPTRFEHALVRSIWEDWFSTDPALFADVYARNRKVVSAIDRWVSPEALATSLWRYGVPEQWDTERQGLNLTGLNEVEKEVTYSDLIAFVGKSIGEPVNYLEIGVSVCKNFLQMHQHFESITGLDVEDLNPRIAAELGPVEQVWQSEGDYPVDTLSGTPTTIRLSHHKFDGGLYVKADQFSPDSWASLKGQRFNLIFSDGVHSPRALLDEMDHLLRNDLIPETGPFVMYWDDLVNWQMQDAFDANCRRLKERFPGAYHGLHWIHGTYGSRRLNGIFSTFRPGAPL